MHLACISTLNERRAHWSNVKQNQHGAAARSALRKNSATERTNHQCTKVHFDLIAIALNHSLRRINLFRDFFFNEQQIKDQLARACEVLKHRRHQNHTHVRTQYLTAATICRRIGLGLWAVRAPSCTRSEQICMEKNVGLKSQQQRIHSLNVVSTSLPR